MKELKRVLKELGLVAVVGLVLGLAINAVNDDGLALGHNYFPQGRVDATQPASQPVSVGGQESSMAQVEPVVNGANQVDPWVQVVLDAGLQVMSQDQVVDAYHDPAYEVGEHVFVDARNDDLYQEGHIPGAYQFDHYFAERYIDRILPACLAAQKVIVYCEGGECEDSRFAAFDLLECGVDMGKVFVYVGGIKAWKKSGLAIEIGERLSGKMTTEYELE